MPASIEKDAFSGHGVDASSTARWAFAVTPHDTVEQEVNGSYPKAFYVGGAGNVAIVPVSNADGATGVVVLAVAAGSYHPIQVRLIRATGTTATGIVGLL